MAKAKSFNYISKKNSNNTGLNTNVWRYFPSINYNKTLRMKI